MVNLRLAKLLNEGRSKNHFLHTVSNAFANNILNFFKENPEAILRNTIVTKPEEFIDQKFLQYLPNLKEITILTIKKPNFKKLINVPEASYFAVSGEKDVEDSTYEFEKGEITITVEVSDKLKSFEEAKHRYSDFYAGLSEFFRHEVQHYIDDEKLESQGGLFSQDKDRSPYRFLTPKQKEEFNYYVTPYEIKAYVKQFMEMAKRERKPFRQVMKDYLFNNQEFSTFNKNPKIKVLLFVLMYKYLEYASVTYNSVREDTENAKYLEKVGAYLDEKGIYVPPPDDEEDSMDENKNFDLKNFKNWLNEASELSKYWKKRAKARAKRAGRNPNNAQDKNWAKEQQEKSMDLSGVLAKAFDEQIKESELLKKQLEEIVSAQKKRKIGRDPFLDAPTGRAKGFKTKSKKYNKKGHATVAPPENFAGFGPMALEEEND